MGASWTLSLGHHQQHGWNIGYGDEPPINYYQEPRCQGGYGYDNRTHQGLAGGVVGAVFGYELGNGHPLATGISAATGSFLGNGVGWCY